MDEGNIVDPGSSALLEVPMKVMLRPQSAAVRVGRMYYDLTALFSAASD